MSETNNYFYKTNFNFLSDSVKNKILELVDRSELIQTYPRPDVEYTPPTDHDYRVFILPEDLNLQIYNSLPKYLQLSWDPDVMSIHLQIFQGQPFKPHIDPGRQGGIIVLFSNDGGITRFYEPVNSQPNYIQHGAAFVDSIDLDCINQTAEVQFKPGEYWLFNHASIHSPGKISGKRMTLNIKYHKLIYQDLLDLYLTNL